MFMGTCSAVVSVPVAELQSCNGLPLQLEVNCTFHEPGKLRVEGFRIESQELFEGFKGSWQDGFANARPGCRAAPLGQSSKARSHRERVSQN